MTIHGQHGRSHKENVFQESPLSPFWKTHSSYPSHCRVGQHDEPAAFLERGCVRRAPAAARPACVEIVAADVSPSELVLSEEDENSPTGTLPLLFLEERAGERRSFSEYEALISPENALNTLPLTSAAR